MISVYIISSYLMFGYGLESLLHQEERLKILGQETDAERAIEQIKELQPEVVILYREDTLHSSRAIIVEVLKANPDTRVIALSLQNNTFFVYQATQWITTDPEDLFKAIKDKPSLGNTSVHIATLNQEWPEEKPEG